MGGPTVIMSATFWHLYDIAAATTYSDLTMIAPSCAALAASSVRGGSTITPSNPAVEIFQLTWLTHEYYQIVAVLFLNRQAAAPLTGLCQSWPHRAIYFTD